MMRFMHIGEGFVEKDSWQPDCWVNIEQPDYGDIEFLKEQLRVPDSFLESLADVDERPRVDHEDGWQLTILRVPLPTPQDNKPYTTVPMGILHKGEATVTVCYSKTAVIDDFIDLGRRRSLTVDHSADFIMRVLYSATYWFLQYLKDISTAVNDAEKGLRRSVRNRDLMTLMQLQKTLVYFNTSIHGNEALIEHLRRVDATECDADLLEDLEIEIKQAGNTVGVYSDILAGTMDSYASIISNNVNDIMKRMTSITLILMVPTLVASLYGMNVDGLLLANVPGSFFIVLGISIVLTIATYLILRRIRWF